MNHWNLISPLLAMGPAPQSGQESPPGYLNLIFPVAMLLILYAVMIWPQQKKAKEHQKLLATVKPGDKVLTTSGIIGVIITVKEKSVSLRSADAKLEVLKSAIAEISERGAESKEAQA